MARGSKRNRSPHLMSGWWKRIVGVPLWGNTESTRYGPVSDGRLPEGVGKWVK